MGMTSAAIAGWRTRHDELLDTQAALGSEVFQACGGRPHDAPGSPGGDAGPRRMAGASGRTPRPGSWWRPPFCWAARLQPAELLISGWKGLVEARGAWRRLSDRPAARSTDSYLALPAAKRPARAGASGLRNRADAPGPDQGHRLPARSRRESGPGRAERFGQDHADPAHPRHLDAAGRERAARRRRHRALGPRRARPARRLPAAGRGAVRRQRGAEHRPPRDQSTRSV